MPASSGLAFALGRPGFRRINRWRKRSALNWKGTAQHFLRARLMLPARRLCCQREGNVGFERIGGLEESPRLAIRAWGNRTETHHTVTPGKQPNLVALIGRQCGQAIGDQIE